MDDQVWDEFLSQYCDLCRESFEKAITHGTCPRVCCRCTKRLKGDEGMAQRMEQCRMHQEYLERNKAFVQRQKDRGR